jgi:hypothetical protein
MSNPYHDEQGRFCSKAEMGAAISRLADSGKMDEYFALRTEYEKLSNETFVKPQPKSSKPSNKGAKKSAPKVTGKYDGNTRSLLAAWKDEGIDYTEDQAEIIDKSVKDAYSSGYNNAVATELGDSQAYQYKDYSAKEKAKEALNKAGLDPSRSILLASTKTHLDNEYEYGYGEGARDS